MNAVIAAARSGPRISLMQGRLERGRNRKRIPTSKTRSHQLTSFQISGRRVRVVGTHLGEDRDRPLQVDHGVVVGTGSVMQVGQVVLERRLAVAVAVGRAQRQGALGQPRALLGSSLASRFLTSARLLSAAAWAGSSRSSHVASARLRSSSHQSGLRLGLRFWPERRACCAPAPGREDRRRFLRARGPRGRASLRARVARRDAA